MILQTPKRLALTCIFLISFLFTVHAQMATAEKPALQEVGAAEMQGFIDAGKLAGISTLVVKDGEVLQKRIYGMDNVAESKPINTQTIFRIFSMTKPVTAIALMTLYDEGHFQLDDKVSKYIPAFATTKVYKENEDGSVSMEEQENEMTIRHLLTHTSGLTYGWDPKHYVDSMYRANSVGGLGPGTLKDKVEQLATMPLKYQPGTQWEYSLSIDVAGYIIEVISGMPMDEYFEKAVFAPLDMDDSGFYATEDKLDRLAMIYTLDKEGKLASGEGNWGNFVKEKPEACSGGGGMVSTIEDYSRFCQMLLNGGQLDGRRVLKESTVKLIMTDHLPADAIYGEKEKGFGYGLGGQVHLTSGTYHWLGLASTTFWVNPANNSYMITMAQRVPSEYSYAFILKGILDNAMAEN